MCTPAARACSHRKGTVVLLLHRGRRVLGHRYWCPSGGGGRHAPEHAPPAPLKVRTGRRRPGYACIREGPKTRADAGSAALAMLGRTECWEVMRGRLQRDYISRARRHRSDTNLASELRSGWLRFIQY